MAANVLRQLALDALSAGDVEDAWSIAQARRVVLETVGLDHQPIANLGRPECCPICEKRFEKQ